MDNRRRPPSSRIAQWAAQERRSMSVFCRHHPLEALRPLLADRGFVSARALRGLPSGSRVRVAGLVILVHTPPTQSGRRVMFITLEDETGLLDVVVFSDVQAHSAKSILTCDMLSVEGDLKREGNGLSISVTVRRVIRPWTGAIETLLERAAEP